MNKDFLTAIFAKKIAKNRRPTSDCLSLESVCFLVKIKLENYFDGNLKVFVHLQIGDQSSEFIFGHFNTIL